MDKELLKAKLVKAERAHTSAEQAVSKAKARLELATAKLDELRKEWRKPVAADYRIEVSYDNSRYWPSVEAMLDDVFGDFYKRKDGKLTAKAQAYADAWEHGNGVYCWSATLYLTNRVTGEAEAVDSCGGFYSLENTFERDARKAILETLTPPDVKGEIELVEDL